METNELTPIKDKINEIELTPKDMTSLTQSKKQKYKLLLNEKLWNYPARLRQKWFKKSWFLEQCNIELLIGHSIVMLVVGRTRLGKTWWALTTACLFSDKFIS